MKTPPLLTLLFSLALAVCGFAATPRTSLPLDGDWRFTASAPSPKAEMPGWSQRDFDDSTWMPIRLPHTWNAIDGQDGEPPAPNPTGKPRIEGNYRRGDGFYRTVFNTDPAWMGRRVFVQFDAVNRFAEVWLNGRLLGRHAGGYGRFRFDITEALAPSGPNLLAVKANNEAGGIMPMHGDFTLFGGIYRQVSVISVDPVHIALLDYASPGIYLSTTNSSPASADVAVRTLVENHSPKAATVEVAVTLLNRDGTPAARATVPCALAPGTTATAALSLHLDRPHLWRGRSDPYLYKARIDILSEGRLLDSLEQSLGVRSCTVDPQRGFLLNGQPYALHGVNRHQDRLDKGYAISLADVCVSSRRSVPTPSVSRITSTASPSIASATRPA